jgi:predicted acylesterase/phospholipase RssA
MEEEKVARKIGLALSGGGHRATIFNLGALLYLVDSGKNRDVQTITSVSGGSITNAYLSLLDKPFNEFDAEKDNDKKIFDRHAANLASQVAGSRGCFRAAWGLYVIGMLSLGVCYWEDFFGIRMIEILWPILCLLLLALCCYVGSRSRGTLFAWKGTWLYLFVLTGGIIWAICQLPILRVANLQLNPWVSLLAMVGMVLSICLWCWIPASLKSVIILGGFIVFIHYAPNLWGTSIVIGGAVVLLGLRHRISEQAIGRFLQTQKSNISETLMLQDIQEKVRHIFCSTDIITEKPVYFTRDFILIPPSRLGSSSNISLRTAVQASASLPIAFPFMNLKIEGLSLQDMFSPGAPANPPVLTDGGVYDNTGASWYLDTQMALDALKCTKRGATYDGGAMSAARSALGKAAEEGDPGTRDIMIVNSVNTAASPEKTKWHLTKPLLGFIGAWLILPDKLYRIANRNNCIRYMLSFSDERLSGGFISIDLHPLTLSQLLFSETLLKDSNLGWDSGSIDGNEPVLEKNVHVQQSMLWAAWVEFGSLIPASAERKWRALRVFSHLSGVEIPSMAEKEIKELKTLRNFKRLLNDSKKEIAETVEDPEADPKWEAISAKLEAIEEQIDPLEAKARKREAAMMEAQAGLLKFENELMLLAKANCSVETNLSPLGQEVTARLLYHSYLQAMCTLHVLAGYPLISPVPTIEDFQELAAGRLRPVHSSAKSVSGIKHSAAM